MQSVRSHTEVIDKYLQTEISLARFAGPLPPKAIQGGHFSSFGAIPSSVAPIWEFWDFPITDIFAANLPIYRYPNRYRVY